MLSTVPSSRPRLAAFVAIAALGACDVGAIPNRPDPALAGGDARPLAGDVAITEIAGYQAVRVPLVENERTVPFADRDAQLVAGRDLLIRVRIERPAGAGDRPLVARLDLARPGQAPVDYTEAPVEFPPGASEADVRLDVAGVDLIDGIEYSVSVRENASETSVGDTSRARWPRTEDGTEELEVKQSSDLEVVVVPIAYNDNDAPTPNVGAMADLVQAIYPLEEGGVTVTTGPTVSITVSLAADPNSPYANMFPDGHPFWMSDEVFAELRDLRSKAGSGAYYYGIIDHPTLFGMAEAIPAPLAYGTTNDSIITFAHELGHDLGLRHAPCGGAGGPDPAYPYANATIGVEGWDPRSRQFLDEDAHHDFMSYCAPEWVSDYHFDRLHRQLSTVYALPAGALRPDPVPCDFERERTW